ncbi:kinase-like protein [Gigaspora margarita]|uniref:Kinase-like protein n=1 Tax=Gigaspora margarita TaxID=4874 RepID=A0A8H4EI94_GIGMA|nr:kinase-like protein [Gigaspora margarita]
MKNNYNAEDIKFTKTWQNDNVNTINYSEVKDPKLIKMRGYGIALKGYWNEQLIIMKHIPNDLKNQDKETLRQFILRLSKTNHENILNFLGISEDLELKSYFLVLEYAGNGNLHDYLSENKNLTWPQKIKISKEVACGLEYLHDNINMIHRNLNTKTIIINNGKAQILNPVISELNVDMSSSMPLQDGIGFIDPELLKDLNSQFTKSSDIYSFGMIMWSITSGRSPFANKITLASLIVSKNISEDPIKDTPQAYLDLYSKCCKLNSEERPSAQDAHTQLVQLEKTLQESRNIEIERTAVVQVTTIAVAQNDNDVPVKVLNGNNSNKLQKGLLDEKKIFKMNRFRKFLFCCNRDNCIE